MYLMGVDPELAIGLALLGGQARQQHTGADASTGAAARRLRDLAANGTGYLLGISKTSHIQVGLIA